MERENGLGQPILLVPVKTGKDLILPLQNPHGRHQLQQRRAAPVPFGGQAQGLGPSQGEDVEFEEYWEGVRVEAPEGTLRQGDV